MTEETITRLGIVLELATFIDEQPSNSPCFGPAAGFTTSWFIRQIILDRKSAVASRMGIVRALKESRPDLWERIVPYLDPDCNAVGGNKTSLIFTAKEKATW